MIRDEPYPGTDGRNARHGARALLDDYQGVALSMADWKSLPKDTEVVAFPDHVADEGALAARLADFEFVMGHARADAVPRTLSSACRSSSSLSPRALRNRLHRYEGGGRARSAVCGQRPAVLRQSWPGTISADAAHPVRGIARPARAAGRTASGSAHGKTLGVLDLGTLGSRVARVGPAFRRRCSRGARTSRPSAPPGGATLVPQESSCAL